MIPQFLARLIVVVLVYWLAEHLTILFQIKDKWRRVVLVVVAVTAVLWLFFGNPLH